MAYGMLKLQLRLRLVAGPFAGREPPHRGSQRPFQRLSSGLVCVLAMQLVGRPHSQISCFFAIGDHPCHELLEVRCIWLRPALALEGQDVRLSVARNHGVVHEVARLLVKEVSMTCQSFSLVRIIRTTLQTPQCTDHQAQRITSPKHGQLTPPQSRTTPGRDDDGKAVQPSFEERATPPFSPSRKNKSIRARI